MILINTFQEEFELKVEQLKRIISHKPSLGRFIELLMLDLLKKYLPQKYSYSSGFIYSMSPTQEDLNYPQLDIICYDRNEYPIIFNVEEFVVVVPKSVKGVLEIKTHINTDALRKLIKLGENQIFKEVSFNSKLYLIGVNSNLKPETVFKKIKEYYNSNPKFTTLIGGVYCSNWDKYIHCNLVQKDSKIFYECFLLPNYEKGIASFIKNFILDIYGSEITKSIINAIGTSLHEVIDEFTIQLYSSTGRIE